MVRTGQGRRIAGRRESAYKAPEAKGLIMTIGSILFLDECLRAARAGLAGLALLLLRRP